MGRYSASQTAASAEGSGPERRHRKQQCFGRAGQSGCVAFWRAGLRMLTRISASIILVIDIASSRHIAIFYAILVPWYRIDRLWSSLALYYTVYRYHAYHAFVCYIYSVYPAM